PRRSEGKSDDRDPGERLQREQNKFSFSPNAVIPTAPAIIANKGRQHGAAKAITRAPTDPRPSSKATVRVRRLMLISRLEAVSKNRFVARFCETPIDYCSSSIFPEFRRRGRGRERERSWCRSRYSQHKLADDHKYSPGGEQNVGRDADSLARRQHF